MIMLWFGVVTYQTQKESAYTSVFNFTAWEHITIGSYGLVTQTLKFFVPYYGWLCSHIHYS